MKPRDLSTHTVYEAGRGVEEVARELGVDRQSLITLSSNENPFGPSPRAIDAIRDCAPGVHSYPKSVVTDLRARLADEWTVTPQQVWLANGGDGALDYIARAMLNPGDHVLVPRPGFGYYAMSARYHHGQVDAYRVRKDDEFAITAASILSHYSDERIIYITRPHNPTGSEISVPEIESIAADTDDETLLLVDEAYAEYSDAPSCVPLIADRDDIAVIRTFSKAYGLAGLRLGYVIVPSAWAAAYQRVNTPFATSELACRAGLAALDDDDYLTRSVETAQWARSYYRAELACPTWESAANFVLCDVGDAAAVTEAAKQDGVIVRDTTSFGLPSCIRLTCGTREESRRAVEVLNDII